MTAEEIQPILGLDFHHHCFASLPPGQTHYSGAPETNKSWCETQRSRLSTLCGKEQRTWMGLQPPDSWVTSHVAKGKWPHGASSAGLQ